LCFSGAASVFELPLRVRSVLRCAGCALALVAGCGRLRFDPLTRADDAGPGDASPDAPYHTLETLMVPALGTVVSSTTVLQVGVTYRLRASGTADVGGGILGDAEYWDWTAGTPLDLATNMMVDAGIGIDDPTPALTKTPASWGAYTATHIYEVAWPGTGTNLTANYHDDFPSNNNGNFTLEILGP